MNSTKAPPRQTDWKDELANSFTRIDDLLGFLQLPNLERCREAEADFPFRVTRCYAARMRKADPHDPLLRQVLPLADELTPLPGFVADPVGDLSAMTAPGLLRKYHGRALLVATGACAINCRYCFRREFPYAEGMLSHRREAEVMNRLDRDSSIVEVILSGGDPLVLDDSRFGALIERLDSIPHVQRLRIHSRLPIVLPARINQALTGTLAGTRLATVMVVHANHFQEIDRAVEEALGRLAKAGVVLLNQSVLLKGVNDSVEVLAGLSERLFKHGVLPYYLHLLDKAKGVGHFDLPEQFALDLHEALRRRLPGYLVPRLVREVAGAPYKTLVRG